jgi:hypothetical protein
VGMFLKNRGDLETAKKYLIPAAQSQNWEGVEHVLACQSLRDMKVKVPPVEDAPKKTDAGNAPAKTKAKPK